MAGNERTAPLSWAKKHDDQRASSSLLVLCKPNLVVDASLSSLPKEFLLRTQKERKIKKMSNLVSMTVV